ncbi:MAG: site-specific DNA-methyltransferase [Opitutaceae bacterium]
MPTNYDKLRTLLRELFQMDQADLDFGLYRIMNAKRGEIERFLEHDLLPQVKSELARHTALDSGAKQAELAAAIEGAQKLGVNPDAVPKVQELRAQLKQGGDLDSLENEVFSHLYNFFRRYYHQGDFLSLRRYKEGVYAIPYEGEEVKLYWANHDQYYIKSTEYLRNYTFKLRNNRRVHFKVVEADTEADNNKAQGGKERRFILAEAAPVAVENGELFIRFNYQADARKQTELNAAAVAAVLGNPALMDWISELGDLRPTEKKPNRTLLAKHLDDFTARFAFDYFIHKDLGGFLRRELDFFIKNEIMHLDDVEDEAAPKVELYLSKIKALRKIAHKFIAFLEQLENFQKRLWLKKKFVVETKYCVTLDRVPEALYPEIAANEAQRAEWVSLFAIDEIEADLAKPGYSVPLKVEFLKANPFLVLDTKFFSAAFTVKLLADSRILGGAPTLDAATNGLLAHSENFQALNLLQTHYRNEVQCIYIDPPYNTAKDIFPYKDGYKHGSWLSMVSDRIALSRNFLNQAGVLFSSIDGNEAKRLSLLLEDTFSSENHVGEIVWKNARDNNPTRIAIEHELVLCFARDASATAPEWKNAFSDAKELLLGEYERLKASGCGVEAIQAGIRDFIKDNEGVLGEVDRYKFVDEDGVFTGSQSVHNPHPNGYDYELPHPVTKRLMRKPANGYRFPETTMQRDYVQKDRLIYGPDENRIVQIKVYLKDYRESLRSVIDLDGRLGSYALKALFGKDSDLFDNPKPPQLLKRLISFGGSPNTTVMDYFAGSGSTAQSAIEIGRESSVRVNYILVEMGEYFHTVLKPRLLKVIYSRDWKDGKPLSREGSSHLFKYIRLESYDDCLNNLELQRTPAQDDLLTEAKDFREDYTLRYMLDVETRGSASLLNAQKFTDPFSYKLKVSTGTVGETKDVKVDLVETFNWLVGLKVKHMDHIRSVRVVEGTNPQGDRVLILWRNVSEVPNDKLDEWFKAQGYNTRDQEYDLIYVNGDNHLENFRRTDQTWKVRPIEEDFHRLMWECQDV